MFPAKGPVWQILPELNFKRERVVTEAPEYVFDGGYAIDARLLRRGIRRENTTETRRMRGWKGY